MSLLKKEIIILKVNTFPFKAQNVPDFSKQGTYGAIVGNGFVYVFGLLPSL